MQINKDYILNNSPAKRLLRAHQSLIEEYNEENVAALHNVYSSMKLSDIIEYSRYIFSEPQKGLPFYLSVICNDDHEFCCFTKLKDELEEVQKYVDKYKDNFDEELKKSYDILIDKLNSRIESRLHTIRLSEFCASTGFDEYRLSNLLYDNYRGIDIEDFDEKLFDILFEKGANHYVQKIYVPYIVKELGNHAIAHEMLTDRIDCFNNEDLKDFSKLKSFMDTVSVFYMLGKDPAYTKSVNYLMNPMDYMLIKGCMALDPSVIIKNLLKKPTQKVFFSTMESAVESIYDESYDELFSEDYEESRDTANKVRGSLMNSIHGYVSFLYQEAENTTDPINLPFFNEDCTIEQALAEVSKYADYVYIESEDDDDIFDESKKDNDIGNKSSKNSNAPKHDLATKLQAKAMDMEAKQASRRDKFMRSGQAVLNTAKAFGRLPANIISDIQSVAKKFDEADIKRRKEFMIEPGYRKKIVRNFKMAILYGGAASLKLTYVPLLAILRHFSKDKDRRIRNNLIKEIQTNISICDEKINDAASENDKQKKYQLMRIKSELEEELTRVKLNSKYV